MDEEIRDLLGEVIKAEISDLSVHKSGSKEKSTAIDDLAKLYKLRIEETKNELDYAEKQERRVMESEQLDSETALRQGQSIEQVKDRYFRLGIEAAGIILPLIFYAVWMKKGFKFEEDGTFTSTTFRGLFNRFKPTKK